MLTMEHTLQALKDKILAANFGPIELTLRCNGDKIKIIPFGYNEIHDFNQVEYYICESNRFPYLGSDKLEDIANELNNWPQMLNQQTQDMLRLAKINDQLNHAAENNMNQEQWNHLFSDYSDFYKSVYGHRPHDVHCPFDDILDTQDDKYIPSVTAGDYSASCPWAAPGMSARDFI